MLNQIKCDAWLQHLATGLRCCKLSTNVCDWAMLNHSGSTIDRLKIIVKWGTLRPWRTLCHVIGGQGDIQHVPLSTTDNTACQHCKSSWLWWVQHILTKYCWFFYCSKENTTTIIFDVLNHSQGNFVSEIKRISWSCPDPIFFKNKYPNPILIQKVAIIRRISNPDPVHDHICRRGGTGSGSPESTPAGFCVFFRTRTRSHIFGKN